MRVDERRREHEPGRLDHAVSVRVEVGAELRDRAAVDADVEHRVDAGGGVEDARAADDEVVAAGTSLRNSITPPPARPRPAPAGPR